MFIQGGLELGWDSGVEFNSAWDFPGILFYEGDCLEGGECADEEMGSLVRFFFIDIYDRDWGDFLLVFSV